MNNLRFQTQFVLNEPPVVFRWGVGVDSTGMAIGMHERGERPDFVIFSDTGNEKPETYAYFVEFEAWLTRAGFPKPIVLRNRTQAGDATLEEYSLRIADLPSRAYGHGGCADKWKIRPLEKWSTHEPSIRAFRAAGGKPCALIGYDAGEKRRNLITENARWTFRAPLIEWGWYREDCVKAIERAGLSIPPKSACFFCPSSTKTEIVQLAIRHPDLMRRSIEMEDKARASGKLGTVKGLGRRFSWREFIEADAATRAALPEAPVEACTVCSDDSDDRECT